MPTALVVRAIVANPAKRQAFDEWHKTEMFPAAIKAFGTKQARRSWSLTNPAVHISVYRFDVTKQRSRMRWITWFRGYAKRLIVIGQMYRALSSRFQSSRNMKQLLWLLDH